MKCVIFAGGSFGRDQAGDRTIHSHLETADLIIAADSGAGHLKKLNLFPHFILGDLDSIDPATLEYFEGQRVPFIRYPSKKDKTDTDLCVDFALKKNASDITLAGSTGHRMDHTLANIFLLRRLADLKIPARIIDGHNEIYLMHSSLTTSLEIKGRPNEFLSVIPISETVEGVTLKGLAYPLDNHTIPLGSSLGISNCFKDESAVVTIKKGCLVVTKSRD